MSTELLEGTNLKESSLGFTEAVGQSVANVSPTLTPVLNIVAVISLAGLGSWLVYGLAGIALLFVGLNIATLASRFSAAGSFFVFISRSLGPLLGGLAGFALVAAYICCAMAVVAGTEIFIKTGLQSLGFTAANWILYLVVGLAAGYLCYKDIKFSSRLSVGIEIISVTIITILLIVSCVQHPELVMDSSQFLLKGATTHGMMEASVMAIFSFVGFESAVTLGKETRSPLKTIPRAVITSMLVAGGFFMFVAYTMVIAYGNKVGALGNDASPLKTVVQGLGGGTSAVFFVYVLASASAFACVLASINAGARLLFSMGRYQFVHRSMGLVHVKHQTPYVAILIATVLAFLVPILMFSQGAMNTYDIAGTVSTFGFITAYILISIAAPVYLAKHGQLKVRNIIYSVIGVVAMCGAFFGALYPVPSYPYNILPYIYFIYLALGLVWLFRVKKTAPQILQKMSEDLESQSSYVFQRK
ncbi:APC family permease [Acidithiobacillus ferridurans]|uniref:APC family permease n=1 Tax=Acidithiobacillus ferridurans TaxID=1232575 RepID=UPI001C07D5D1|nr:APC family permease [Acidithiobacillus ferridurans]MBU2732952.1 APC family permease [Acidithiobacillus ferridurans]